MIKTYLHDLDTCFEQVSKLARQGHWLQACYWGQSAEAFHSLIVWPDSVDKTWARKSLRTHLQALRYEIGRGDFFRMVAHSDKCNREVHRILGQLK